MVTNRTVDTFAVVVEALVVMATAREGIISSERIADELGVNAVIIRRLLAPMRAAGYVEARRGVGGGWAIARDPQRLRLGDIYRVLPANQRLRSGVLGRILAKAAAEFIAELDRATLADVMTR